MDCQGFSLKYCVCFAVFRYTENTRLEEFVTFRYYCTLEIKLFFNSKKSHFFSSSCERFGLLTGRVVTVAVTTLYNRFFKCSDFACS